MPFEAFQAQFITLQWLDQEELLVDLEDLLLVEVVDLLETLQEIQAIQERNLHTQWCPWTGMTTLLKEKSLASSSCVTS